MGIDMMIMGMGCPLNEKCLATYQKNDRQQKSIQSLMGRGRGIWNFQHCIVITRGQEERDPKRRAFWKLTLASGRFALAFGGGCGCGGVGGGWGEGISMQEQCK